MKPILVDDFIKDSSVTMQCTKVEVDGVTYNVTRVAKPLNYDAQFHSIKDRITMAIAVLRSKAIAVRYFRYFTKSEQLEYAKQRIEERNKLCDVKL